MRNIFLVLSFLTCLLFTACRYSEEYQVINVNNQFSVSIPSWMKKYDELKEGAPFQYANRYRNFYSIATVEPKTSNLNDLLTANLFSLRRAMQGPIVSDSAAVTIGGLNGVRMEVFGKMHDEHIYFSELLLEGKKGYYHLSVWTRGEERKLRYKEDINKIIASFKEL